MKTTEFKKTKQTAIAIAYQDGADALIEYLNEVMKAGKLTRGQEDKLFRFLYDELN